MGNDGGCWRVGLAGFKVIAKFVAASRVGANLGELLDLIEHTADFGVKHVSKNAICCASEVALKLTNYNGWIQHTPIVCSSFEHLIGTDIGVDVVDLFTTICANEENANWLDSQGFFSLLNNLPCDDKCDSELWPHIFNFMAAMPKHSRIPGLFLGNHFSRISFFLSPDAKAAMTPAKAFKAQLAITDLLAHITLYSHEFFEENPAIFDSIQEKIYMKMEHSVKYLRETPYVELEGTLGSIDTYSEKLCNLCMLRNCLVFMNRRYDFPLGEICKVVTESHTNQFPLEEALEKALEVLHQALKSNDPAFAPVIVQTFELALRIITGAIYKVVGTVPTREKRNSVLRSIKQMSDGLSKTTNVDSQPVQEFFDAVSTFLANL